MIPKTGTRADSCFWLSLDLVVGVQLLNVLGVRHFNSFDLAWGLELLATTQLFDDAGLIEFTFEFLNRALDILAFLYGYDDHCITPPFTISNG